MPTPEQARTQCNQLHELGEMEPEDIYQEVAWNNGIEVEELYELLASDCE